MKVRPFIIGVAMLVLAAVAILLYKGTKAPITGVSPTQTNGVLPTGGAVMPQINAPVQRGAVANAAATPHRSQSPSPAVSEQQRAVGILSTYNDAPIDFYGRLEDQFGSPVTGAQVKASIMVDNGQKSGTDHLSATTDANGLFEFHGKGENIGVTPHKDGYTLASTNTGGIYSALWPADERQHPDPQNPMVIKMWKLQGADHLIKFNIETHVPVDGSAAAFDLQTGQQVANGGDLTVRLQSPAIPRIREKYAWQAAIQMIGGGILKASDAGLSEMFQAPQTGYEPEFTLGFQNDAQPWNSRFNADFYFTCQGGKYYGKLWLEIDTDKVRNGAALLTLKGYVNPVGSRNLEVDPAMVTVAHP